MTDKEIIRKEIERWMGLCPEHGSVLGKLCDFIDSMQKELGSKVWHDGNEEPKDMSKTIICQIGDKSKTVYTMEYHASDKNFHITSPLGNDYIIGIDYPGLRWAYPEDLLPNI